MAEPTFCTVAEVGYKAGANKSATSAAEAYVLAYAKGVEGFINTYCNYNFSDAYAGLNADVKYLLNEIQSNLTAIYVINYDTSGFVSRAEAELMMDVLRDGAYRNLNILKEADKVDFINGA